MLRYFYGDDDVEDGEDPSGYVGILDRKLINLAVDYCPAIGACTTSQNWPSDSNPNHRVSTLVTSSDGVTGVRYPGSQSNDITISYSAGKVSSVAYHFGSWSYASSDAGGVRTVSVTDPDLETTTYTFDIASERLTGVTNALGKTTSYAYDAKDRLERVTRPENNYTHLTYDDRGNVTETRHVDKNGTGPNDIVTTAVYPDTCTNIVTCNRPTSTTDARGNTTDYEWDQNHGGLLSVIAPAPVANATRPKKTFIYVAKQAQIKNASGGFVGTGITITLPQTVSECQTQSSCAGQADEVRTTIAYGGTGIANNLLPVSITNANGTGTLSATTSLAYDAIGNVTAIDGPLAGGDDTTTALYNQYREATGVIAPDPDGAGSRPRIAERRSYGSAGELVKTEVGTVTAASQAALDVMNVAQFEETGYDADKRPIKTIFRGGGTTHGVTQLQYDSVGRLKIHRGADGPGAVEQPDRCLRRPDLGAQRRRPDHQSAL